MAGAVLVYFADDTLEKVDAIVRQKKIAKKPAKPPSDVSEKARSIAEAKGVAAANEFLRCWYAENKVRRPSRVALLGELVELGLKHYKAA